MWLMLLLLFFSKISMVNRKACLIWLSVVLRGFFFIPQKETNNICLPLLFLPKGAISAGEAGEEAEAKHRVGPHPGVGHQAAGQARAVNSAPPGSQVLGLCHLKNINSLCYKRYPFFKKTLQIFTTSKVIRVTLLNY